MSIRPKHRLLLPTRPALRRSLALATTILLAVFAQAELCTTQSQMTLAVRDPIATTARSLALKVQANDTEALKSQTIPEYAKDFGGIAYTIANTAPYLRGAILNVDQVYLLDATMTRKLADGSIPDAQFFCSLNRSPMETDFIIPSLPPGRYAFAMVNAPSAQPPYRLSMLLRQDDGQWLLAGIFPQQQTAAGHDGLWYWRAARDFAAQKQPWDAWVFYQQAQSLLRPATFVQSTHLEKLRNEQLKAAPPALAEGIGPDTPLVVKGPAGAEYRFTSLDTDDSLSQSKAQSKVEDKVDLAVHLKAEPISDPIAARKRNADAMTALLTAFPELRKPFHGVWVFADTGAATPFATEQAMSEIP